MFIIEFIEVNTLKNPVHKMVVGDVDSLFTTIMTLDESRHVKAWRIQEHKPKDFGWTPNWKKCRDKFLREDFEAI